MHLKAEALERGSERPSLAAPKLKGTAAPDPAHLTLAHHPGHSAAARGAAAGAEALLAAVQSLGPDQESRQRNFRLNPLNYVIEVVF